MVYQQGDQVVYGIHGVCNIMDIVVRRIDRKNVEYYVLQPLEQPDSRYYIPTQSAAAVAKICPVLTKQEVADLLQGVGILQKDWIEDENQRKQYYKALIGSGDRAALMSMIYLLHQHKNRQLQSGRKFHTSDENFLRDAEKLISGELSLVLGIPKNEVGQYIQDVLDVNN